MLWRSEACAARVARGYGRVLSASVRTPGSRVGTGVGTNTETGTKSAHKNYAYIRRSLHHATRLYAESSPRTTGHERPAGPNSHNDWAMSELQHAVDAGSFDKAWHIVETQLFGRGTFPDAELRRLLGRVLALADIGPHITLETWERVRKLVFFLGYGRMGLRAQDYAAYMRAAFFQRDHQLVEEIWAEAKFHGAVSQDVSVWHAYIMASCNCHFAYWEMRKKRAAAPAMSTNNAIALLQEMSTTTELEPTHRSYELAVLYLGQYRETDALESLVGNVWGIYGPAEEGAPAPAPKLPAGSPLWPRESTLVAVLEAFAVNDMFLQGMGLVDGLRRAYGIEATRGPFAEHFWEKVLDLCELTTPVEGVAGGNTPPEVFDGIWAHIGAMGVAPTGHMYRLRTKQLARSKRNRELLALADEVDAVESLEFRGQIIAGCLARAGGFKSAERTDAQATARRLSAKYEEVAEVAAKLDRLDAAELAKTASPVTTESTIADPDPVIS